jgi:hypothetical protein
MNEVKDFFGVVLNIRDTIAFNPPSYKGLTKGTILAFTPQKVKIKYFGLGSFCETYMFHQDVVKNQVDN